MRNPLDSFVDGLPDTWQSEDLIGEEPSGKRPSMPGISWLRQHLRRQGASPKHAVLSAARRAGYPESSIQGTFERNPCYFKSTGDLWQLKATAQEWLADFLLESGEMKVADILRCGQEAGFQRGTITTAKGNIPNLVTRREGRTFFWRMEIR